MKYFRNGLLIFLLAFSMLFAQPVSVKISNDKIPKILKNYLNQVSSKAEYKEIPDYIDKKSPSFISKEQALEDINMLKYILETGYSGKDYWGKRGIDFNGMFSSLLKYIDKNNLVSVIEIENIIFKYLENMADGHTKIIGNTYRELARSYLPYFTEIILEKKNNNYYVVESNEKSVIPGEEYTASKEYLFRTISSKNSERFLLGVLNTKNPNTLKTNFNNKNKIVSLHLCRISNIKENNKVVEIEEQNNIPVIRVSSFLNKYQKELMKFVESGYMLKQKEIFILNLLNNDGGDAQYPRTFVEKLNGSAVGFDYLLTLHSPAIVQAYLPKKNLWLKDLIPEEWLREDIDSKKLPPEIIQMKNEITKENKEMLSNPRRYWEVMEYKNNASGTYKGRAIVLSNFKVGSSGNNALAFTKSISNSVIIGSNSSSGFTFADVVTYCLKNSLIKIRLPIKLIIHKNFDNEKGFLPDYWLDSNQPEQEVIKWINNSEKYQFTYK